MIRISLLHPSRSRPELAFYAVQEWLGKADNPSEIEYLMGLDSDDSRLSDYELVRNDVDVVSRYDCGLFKFIIDKPNTLVGIVNGLASHMSDTTQLIIAVSDDMSCPKHWDTLLWNELRGVDCSKELKFVGVWDGVINTINFEGKTRTSFLCYFIATKAWYTEHGYLIYPEYIVSWADFDWTGYIRTRDRTFGTSIEIDARHLIFPHRHYQNGVGTRDDVNKRLHSNDAMEKGKLLFKRRLADCFGCNSQEMWNRHNK